MANPALPLLLVDDEPQMLLALSMTLETSGFDNVSQCERGEEALERLAAEPHSAAFLDMMMPGLSGTELLGRVAEAHPDLPVIMVTAVNDLDTAVECMKLGAVDYLVKPVNDTRLVTTARRAIELSELRSQNSQLRRYLLTGELERPEAFESIVTENDVMRSLCQYIEAVARSSQSVLITGETGVGKELFARAVHASSSASGELVTVNVAGLDDSLFSDTLFGHEKGAFTGADRPRRGLIERAAGGTLFLDEIGDLSQASQVKLLRLLQEGEYYPIGSDKPKHTDARVVVATLKDLDTEQREGRFRKDLYYRLYTHEVQVPPLRDRKEDLPVLLDCFLSRAAAALGKAAPTPPAELFVLLRSYHFPGNVRELEAMVHDAVTVHRGGVLSTKSFRQKMGHDEEIGRRGATSEASGELLFPEPLPTLRQTEGLLIDEALRRADGNQRLAAELLGLSRRALNNRLKRSC